MSSSSNIQIPYTRISTLPIHPIFQFKNCPLLKIGLLSDCTLVKVLAYIDTGAQPCLFDNSYAKELGIKDYKDVNKEHIIPISGVGGKQPENIAYFHDLKLVIFKDQNNLRLKNALEIVETKIGFLEKPISFAGLLGVYGFLDRFIFTANIPDGYFELAYKFKTK